MIREKFNREAISQIIKQYKSKLFLLCVIILAIATINFSNKIYLGLAKSISMHKAHANTAELTGITMLKLNKYQEAANLFEYAIKIDKRRDPSPHLYKAYFFAGKDLYNGKSYDEATKYFTKAITVNKDFAYGYYFRAKAQQSAGNLTDALQDLDKAVELSPNFPSLYINRSLVQIKLKNFDFALDDAKRAVSILARGKNHLLLKESVILIREIEHLKKLQTKEPRG